MRLLLKCNSNYLNIINVSAAVTVHRTAMQGFLCMSMQIQRNITCGSWNAHHTMMPSGTLTQVSRACESTAVAWGSYTYESKLVWYLKQAFQEEFLIFQAAWQKPSHGQGSQDSLHITEGLEGKGSPWCKVPSKLLSQQLVHHISLQSWGLLLHQHSLLLLMSDSPWRAASSPGPCSKYSGITFYSEDNFLNACLP